MAIGIELLWILIATFLDSIISLVGIISLWFNERFLKGILKYLVSFAAGSLLGGSFFHLFPEAIEDIGYFMSAGFLMIGFVMFFLMEKAVHWHHCEEDGKCKLRQRKSFVELVLIGDGLHNFIDGLVIAAGFLVNVPFGIITTFLIVSHEVPQEIGDFGVLVYGGLKRKKALLYNFISQATCILGGIIGYFISTAYSITSYLLPFAAGGFIYIAASDLIPELHKEKGQFKTGITFIIGLLLMIVFKLLAE
jgi:zinc and cadmium transporter